MSPYLPRLLIRSTISQRDRIFVLRVMTRNTLLMLPIITNETFISLTCYGPRIEFLLGLSLT
jgi:hypothetical protein